MGGRPEALVLLLVAGVCANENGLARRPPMGWRSWNLFGAAVDQRLMERVMAGLEDRHKLRPLRNLPSTSIKRFQSRTG